MSQYHSILFYTNNPGDKLSQQILKELKNYPELKDQIRLICVSNPNLKLPKLIEEQDKFPLIVTRGFEEPIMGEHALSWIKEGHFSGRANGYEFGDIDKADKVDDGFGTLATESSRTEYHQAFNDEYNRDGVAETQHVLNSKFSNINDSPQSLDTFEEGKTKGHSESSVQLRKLQMLRDNDVPKPLAKIQGPPPGMGDNRRSNSNNPFLQQQNNNPFSPSIQQNPMMVQQPGGFNNPYANPRPPPYGGFTNNNIPQQQQQPNLQANVRGNFHPPAPNNPMVPQHPGNLGQPNGTAFPPQVSNMGGRPQQNVPNMPQGFGNSGVSLDDAYGGNSLLGHMKINNQFNGRREQSLIPGLPTGRGQMGPSQTGTSTRLY